MKNLKLVPSVLSIAFALACFNTLVLAQAIDDKNQFASVNSFGSSVRFDVNAPHASVTLTVTGPEGVAFTKEFKSGDAPEFKLSYAKGERMPDGVYTYELRLAPNFAAETKAALRAAREKGNEAEVTRELNRKGALPQGLVQSGSFMVSGGSVILAGATEAGAKQARVTSEPAAAPVQAVSTGRINYKVQRHHPRFMVFDQVIPDDLIVQGSICAGLDCVNNENFGFDTIRLKENNTRIQFDDTSSSAGFATNNWQIRANNSASGGASFLAFVDQGATGNSETGTIVFEVDAGAPANSLKVSSGGNVGIGTATPVLDVHANTTDTPAIRLEQNNSGGFTAQTWDIGGNEANFFVRDVTSGSRLPFRIRPGAPTSSIDISADGDTGINTASPNLKLEVLGNVGLPVNSGTVPTGITRFSQSGGVGVIDFGFGGATGAGWLQTTSSANLATNFPFLVNPNGGNVGIGTTAPTDTLSVNGTASKPGGGNWAVFSDQRLKNIKGNFTSGLNAVMKLQPVRYEYKPDNAMGIKAPGEFIGFGAQAVQQVIPEAVTTNSSGYLMVNNDPIIWTMLNAIKEQQKEIVELKKQVRQLRAQRKRK
ncbi:MAG TPA: tail fiber domain-containing protein [Pyrinomonadaceae bacterium]|nr:tail fiber domain-containing protein [Pyrinomonadaceae bacterium]